MSLTVHCIKRDDLRLPQRAFVCVSTSELIFHFSV